MNQIRPESATPPFRIDAREFHANVAEYLHRARQGASFLITLEGETVAELHPPPAPPAPKQRIPGRLKGKIWMADDFDTWPEGFIEEMTEGAIFPPENKSK